ncbi:MAG: hypothetical protein U1F25_20355 [Rubrivivax sp.]
MPQAIGARSVSIESGVMRYQALFASRSTSPASTGSCATMSARRWPRPRVAHRRHQLRHQHRAAREVAFGEFAGQYARRPGAVARRGSASASAPASAGAPSACRHRAAASADAARRLARIRRAVGTAIGRERRRIGDRPVGTPGDGCATIDAAAQPAARRRTSG